jgi:hypothetical protein
VLIAASSNNVLKAPYAVGFAGLRPVLPPAIGLGCWRRVARRRLAGWSNKAILTGPGVDDGGP